MRPMRPPTMSFKLMAMVVVRKKMDKLMMMVWVCVGMKNEGEGGEDEIVKIFIEGICGRYL